MTEGKGGKKDGWKEGKKDGKMKQGKKRWKNHISNGRKKDSRNIILVTTSVLTSVSRYK